MNSFSIDTMAKEDGPPVTGGPALHDAACKTLDYVQIESKYLMIKTNSNSISSLDIVIIRFKRWLYR